VERGRERERKRKRGQTKINKERGEEWGRERKWNTKLLGERGISMRERDKGEIVGERGIEREGGGGRERESDTDCEGKRGYRGKWGREIYIDKWGKSIGEIGTGIEDYTKVRHGGRER
jgi:hypothetical protein